MTALTSKTESPRALLDAFVERFAAHDSGCSHAHPLSCSCGFEKALGALEAALATPETSRVDPLAAVRWICGKCTTVNGIDDTACLGCRKPREEHDSRVKSTANPTHQHAEGCPKLSGGECACAAVPL